MCGRCCVSLTPRAKKIKFHTKKTKNIKKPLFSDPPLSLINMNPEQPADNVVERLTEHASEIINLLNVLLNAQESRNNHVKFRLDNLKKAFDSLKRYAVEDREKRERSMDEIKTEMRYMNQTFERRISYLEGMLNGRIKSPKRARTDDSTSSSAASSAASADVAPAEEEEIEAIVAPPRPDPIIYELDDDDNEESQ